jgi:hypothetical protein
MHVDIFQCIKATEWEGLNPTHFQNYVCDIDWKPKEILLCYKLWIQPAPRRKLHVDEDRRLYIYKAVAVNPVFTKSAKWQIVNERGTDAKLTV